MAKLYLYDHAKSNSPRASTVKASGENPFLPEHIRARLHGNNPPPSFAQSTARRIASTSRPTTLLGSTSAPNEQEKSQSIQQELIDGIIKKMMPEIEKELRQRLTLMSESLLQELKNSQ